MSDAQWAAVEPVLPAAASQVGPGRPEAHARRLILDAVFYLVAEGFAVLPRRWVVERTLAWLTRNRGLVRGYERRADTHEAMTTIAMIALTSRRLARAA